MKKLIALFLCLVLVFGMVACGAKAEPEVEEPAPGVEETKEPAAAPEEVVPEKPEEIAPELGALPLVTEETTITIGLPQIANTEDYETNEYTKWVEEQTGINLDFVYFSADSTEAVTQLNLMIAGGEKLPDILWGMKSVNQALMFELGSDGYLVDIKDYFTDYGYYFWEEYEYVDELDREGIFQYGTNPDNGALYAFPSYVSRDTDTPASFPVINATWLEAIGENAPTNVDELYNVLKKFATEDPNGNGIQDEIPLIGYAGGYKTDIVPWVINAFVQCLDSNFFNAADGQIWVPYNTDEYRQAMIYLNKLYAEGLLSPLSYTISKSAEYKPVITPADGVNITGIASMHPVLHVETGSTLMNEYAALAPLEAATELGGYAAMNGPVYEYCTFITADCEDPVLAFKLLDFMCGQESYLRSRYGVYGTHWEWAEDGALCAVGAPAAVKVLDSAPYSTQNNDVWHDMAANIREISRWEQVFALDDPDSFDSRRTMLCVDIYNQQANYKQQPAEPVYKIIYNLEEQNVVDTLLSQLKTYVSESRAMFIAGVMDPNNDADWNTYLDNLEAQNLSQLIDVAQTAYTRMTAK